MVVRLLCLIIILSLLTMSLRFKLQMLLKPFISNTFLDFFHTNSSLIFLIHTLLSYSQSIYPLIPVLLQTQLFSSIFTVKTSPLQALLYLSHYCRVHSVLTPYTYTSSSSSFLSSSTLLSVYQNYSLQ